MRKRMISMLSLVLTVMLTFGTCVMAAPAPITSVPANIKTIDQLTDYLMKKGVVKTYDDFRNFMENNKLLIKKISPKVIDYGFTTRFYMEMNTPLIEKQTTINPLVAPFPDDQEWVTHVSIMSNDDIPQEISKESFSIVPALLEKGKEITVLALSPQYIVDSTTGNEVDKVMIKKGEEKYIGVVFRVNIMTTSDNVKLRLYDGKDHTDIKISNP